MMDLSGQKWEAILPLFDLDPDKAVGERFYTEAKTRINFYTVVQLKEATTAYLAEKTRAPIWWSHLAEFLPKRGQKASAAQTPSKTDNPAWWGNEGAWGGDWSKASGFSMILPLAVMTVNLNPRATSNHMAAKVAEFRRLAINQGADVNLIERAIEFCREGRQLSERILRDWQNEE